MDFRNLENVSANQKSSEFHQMFVISEKKTIPIKKSAENDSLAYRFLFFVISI